jgi:glycosyltransferase involved in cell wall biosynthesis
LIEIANALDPAKFEIDAFGDMEQGYFAKMFEGTQVNYKGGFRGIDSIAPFDYDAFLYTSRNDGVPNILLEVAARGLPIVATDAGGVCELIGEGRGVLVRHAGAAPDYVAALERMRDEAFRASCAMAVQRILEGKFSLAGWKRTVSRDFA